jgi:sugar lactone lactonase YvrE
MEVTTLAGSGRRGYRNVPAGSWVEAEFDSPCGVAVDGAGIVYVADSLNNRIRKILPDGEVSIKAGSIFGFADGVGAEAQFKLPTGIAVDSAGVLYVADKQNHRIRKILPDGTVSTLAGSRPGFADGVGAAARFSYPSGIAVDSAGIVYVADTSNNAIRKIALDGTVSTFVGTTARFDEPYGIAVDRAGVVYVADSNNNLIRKILPDGTVSTLAGRKRKGFVDGVGDAAQLTAPLGIVVDGAGVVYVADSENNRIRKILPDGTVSTFAGRGGELSAPHGIAIDREGNFYVADTENHQIKKLKQSRAPIIRSAALNENEVPSESGIPYENLVSSVPSNLSALPTTYRDVVKMEDVAPDADDYTFFVVGKNGFALNGEGLRRYTKDNEFKLYRCREGMPLTSIHIRESDVHMMSPIRVLQFAFPVHVLDKQAQLIQPGRTYRLTPTAKVLGQVASHATIRGESVASGNHCQEKKTDRMYKIEEIPRSSVNTSSYENLLGLGSNDTSAAASKPNYGLSNLNQAVNKARRGQMIENAFRGLGGRRERQTKRHTSKSRKSRKGSRSTRKARGTRRR